MRMDAEIGLNVAEHLLAPFTAAIVRPWQPMRRCENCCSYRLWAGVCEHCEWVDPNYRPPEVRDLTDEERVELLAKPCVPTSDISTFIGPDYYRQV
jgi:hypothetical protein